MFKLVFHQVILSLFILKNQATNDALNCDFNTNDCTWYTIDSSPLTWEWTGSQANGTHGGYLNVPKRQESILGQWSPRVDPPIQLQSSVRHLWYIPRTGCFTFAYQFYATTSSWLNLTIEKTSGETSLLWSIKDGHSLDWSKVSVDIGDSPEFRLIFSVSIDLINFSISSVDWIVSLDDFSFMPQQCSDFTLCDFETGSCHWKLNGWHLVSASSEIPVDHTTLSPSGHFIVPEEIGSLSSLILTPLPSPIKKGCLTFWTYIDLRKEKPKLVIRDESEKPQTIDLERPSPNNQTWQYHQVAVSLSSKNISIETILDSSSVIALDDLVLYDKPCPNLGSCDFSYDFCGWSNSGNSKWIRQIGVLPLFETKSRSLAQQFDRQQWYVISSSNQQIAIADKGKSVFESTPMVLESSICFSFSYFFTISDSQSYLILSLSMLDSNGNYTVELHELERIPLNSDLVLNWNHFERTITVTKKTWYVISVIYANSVTLSSVLVMDDLNFQTKRCTNESPLNELDKTTITSIVSQTSAPTTTTSSPYTGPYIWVLPDSTTFEPLTDRTTTSTSAYEFLESSTLSTRNTISTEINEQITNSSVQLIIPTESAVSTFPQTNAINKTTPLPSTENLQTTIVSVTHGSSPNHSNSDQSIISSQSEFGLPTVSWNHSEFNSTDSSVDNNTDIHNTKSSEPSTFDPSVWSITTMSSTLSTYATISVEPDISLKDELMNNNETDNSYKTINFGNLGSTTAVVLKFLFGERSFIASLCGTVGLAILIISIIILSLNWKKSPRPRQMIVSAAPGGIELPAYTFRRQAITLSAIEAISNSQNPEKSLEF